MQRGSINLTPVYFFTSVRAGSGKATIVSNLSVYLNSIGFKIAILDFDYKEPSKLENSFPKLYELKKYSEFNKLVSAENPRFQQNFYFTDTNKISFFPTQNFKTPYLALTDAAFKDFFIQLTNTFDYILINLASGTSESISVSDLLSKTYLLYGCKPSSLIVSLSDEESLIQLDNFIKHNQIVSYQAEENTYFVFNKIPSDIDKREQYETLLNSSDIRKLFNYPLIYIIPRSDEFNDQLKTPNAIVLNNNSFINQHIVGLYRLLNGAASISYLMRESNTYHSCISGTLLNQIYPYLEEIQLLVAHKLFINPKDVNIYLEQNDNNFRIRIRLSSLSQNIIRIRNDIPNYQRLSPIRSQLPSKFEPQNIIESFRAIKPLERESNYILSFKSIFTFDDSFYTNPDKIISSQIPIKPTKNAYPSPILFPQRNKIPEIPTLSNILGLVGQQKYVNLIEKPDEINNHGVNPVYIPTEFALSINKKAREVYRYLFENNFIKDNTNLRNEITLDSSYDYIKLKLEDYSIFDIFARDKKFEFTSNFGIKVFDLNYYFKGITSLPSGKFSLFNENLIEKTIKPLSFKDDIKILTNIKISDYRISVKQFNLIPYKTSWKGNYLSYYVKSPDSYIHSSLRFNNPEFIKIKTDFNFKPSEPVFNINYQIYQTKINTTTKVEINRIISTRIEPKNFNLSSPIQNFKSGFLSKNFRPLPANLSLEDVMLEYCYIIQVKETKSDFIYYRNLLKGNEFKPQLRYNFEHKYMEPDLLIRRSTYKKPVIYQLFKLDKLAVSNKVSISSIDYKVAYNEIFPVVFFPKAIEISVTRKFTLPKWINTRRDYSSELNMFKLHIEPLKLIKGNPGSYETILPTKIIHCSKYFDPHYNLPVINPRTMALNKPEFLRDYLKYPEFKLTNIESTYLISLENNIEFRYKIDHDINSKFNSEINAPEIFIERLRYKYEKFYSYGWKDPAYEITKFDYNIYLKTPLKIQTFIHHPKQTLINLRDTIQSKYPIRYKTIKLIDNFTKLKEYHPTFEQIFNFINKPLNIYILQNQKHKFDNVAIQKPLDLKYTSAKIVSYFILKKLAVKIPSPKLGRGKFFIIPENASDILYKHLLWQFSNASGPTYCEYNEKFLLNDHNKYNNNFDVFYKLKAIPTNIEFLHHDDITLKLNKNIVRKKYNITNNRIKDLLALAKAVSARAANLTSIKEAKEI